ncbi:hypothetical protein ABIA33_004913 [Streptacidiphilus sp. MAP12-16]
MTVARAHTEEVVGGAEDGAVVKLGVWISNTKTRRDKTPSSWRL